MKTLKRIVLAALFLAATPAHSRPNILLAISDDQSWPHTSADGSKMVNTPAFDRIAQMGVRFTNCFAGSPGCSPSRAVMLTGLNHWQIEQAGTHASSFPQTYPTYPDQLETAGYFVGYTGKGWGPGNHKISGRVRNPAGTPFSKKSLKPPLSGISSTDYAENFADFLKARPKDQPFCFWFGAHEPHRAYEKGSGLKAGKKLEDAEVPAFLPDTPEIRSDLLDYALEIEWFDQHLDKMLKMLEAAGELDNTFIIVTADNGMPFPRAKANVYESGIHMPLTIAWPKSIPGKRVVDDLVGFTDLNATILEAAELQPNPVGHSLIKLLKSEKQGLVEPDRQMVFSGRERHSSSRPDNLGYPSRALRTQDFLYIRNFAPDRWPAGDPQTLGKPMHSAYHDIDPCPSLTYLINNQDKYFHLAVDKRPAEELYNIKKDPDCVDNLATKEPSIPDLTRLREAMNTYLAKTKDPRVGQDPNIWETYKRYSPIRKFPGDKP